MMDSTAAPTTVCPKCAPSGLHKPHDLGQFRRSSCSPSGVKPQSSFALVQSKGAQSSQEPFQPSAISPLLAISSAKSELSSQPSGLHKPHDFGQFRRSSCSPSDVKSH